MEDFSVIIIVYNKVELLRKSLISINHQSLIPKEVIITDDGSEDNIIAGISDLIPSFKFELKFIKQPHNGFRAAKARNNAIKIATCEKIIFYDQDIISTKNYVKTFIENLNENKFIVSYPIRLTESQSINIDENKIVNFDFSNDLFIKQKLKIKQQFLEDGYAYLMKKNKLIRKGVKLRAGVFATRKSDLILVNGFDENYSDGGREDDDLGNRLNAINIIGFNPFWNEYPLHLFHLPNYQSEKKINNNYYKNRKIEISNGLVKCEFGLDNPKGEDKVAVLQLK
ncbi:MAG: glycosyltransferase [Ignavibacteriae bacterium]|nr:glycosyltransferase [Ignavibacteriota bacterium]